MSKVAIIPHYDDEAIFLWSVLPRLDYIGVVSECDYIRRTNFKSLLKKVGCTAEVTHFRLLEPLYDDFNDQPKIIEHESLDKSIFNFLGHIGESCDTLYAPDTPPWSDTNHALHIQLLEYLENIFGPGKHRGVDLGRDSGRKVWTILSEYPAEAAGFILHSDSDVSKILREGFDYYREWDIRGGLE